MVLKQMVLVVKTDSGTYSNTFLTKPSLLRRTVRETIMKYAAFVNSLLQYEHITSLFQNLECLLHIHFAVQKVLTKQKDLRVHVPIDAMNTQASRRAA